MARATPGTRGMSYQKCGVHVRPGSGQDPLDADDDAAPMAGSAEQPGKEVVIAGAVLTTSPVSSHARQARTEMDDRLAVIYSEDTVLSHP
jgi:hypothetical protein